MGAPNENQAGDQASRPLTSTSERSSLPNVCNLPAFQSVLEMGYPSHVIQEAFDVLKNTEGQGKAKKRLCIVYLHINMKSKYNRFLSDFSFQST